MLQVNKYVLRVDDVGRRPEDTPEQGTDGDLSYFFSWRKAIGLIGLPVYYGVVSAWITQAGRAKLVYRLNGDERVAIHGWDHLRGSTMDRHRMNIARGQFSSLSLHTPFAYIPPFNWYSVDTLQDWKAVGGKYFFGRFPEDYPSTGLHSSSTGMPTIQHGLLYLPAYKPLYGHAWEILRTLYRFKQGEIEPIPYPIVVTIHVPWDNRPDWGTLAGIIDHIRPNLITLEEVEKGLPYGD